MIFSPVLFYDVDKRSFTYREEHSYWIGVKGTRSIKGEKNPAVCTHYHESLGQGNEWVCDVLCVFLTRERQ